jgi:hypothetical protein
MFIVSPEFLIVESLFNCFGRLSQKLATVLLQTEDCGAHGQTDQRDERDPERNPCNQDVRLGGRLRAAYQRTQGVRFCAVETFTIPRLCLRFSAAILQESVPMRIAAIAARTKEEEAD